MAFGWASKYIIWYFTWAWDHSEKSFWFVVNIGHR